MSWNTPSALSQRLSSVGLAFAVAVSALVLAAPSSAQMAVDPENILKESGVYGVYNTFKLRPSYGEVSMEARDGAAAEVAALIEDHSENVLVQAYLTRGYEGQSDFMLRLHAYEPANAQAFLTDFAATAIGRHSDVETALIGVTKSLNYTTEEKAPALLEQLKAGKYTADEPRYAFMIPIKKDAEWWNLSDEERLAEMIGHTAPTLAYLSNVKRKLYHSTGLDDTDFITYFETNDLVAFNDLNIALHSVPEMLHNTRYGRPIVMGTIMPVEEVITALSK